jgi:aflatoxin B1 aldehyde reductase
MFGRVLQASGTRDSLEIVTKAHPSQKDGLTPAGLRAQVEASLSALQIQKIDLLYLHQPDKTSALSDTLATVNDLMTEGAIGSFGLSNYSAIEVDRCVDLCKAAGYALPAVYQGLYNAINRRVEDELLPTLRKHGMAFVAYNPLAAGLLTGKHVQEGEVMKGRFKDNPNYLNRFYKPDLFEGLSLVRSACEAAEVTMVRTFPS